MKILYLLPKRGIRHFSSNTSSCLTTFFIQTTSGYAAHLWFCHIYYTCRFLLSCVL